MRLHVLIGILIFAFPPLSITNDPINVDSNAHNNFRVPIEIKDHIYINLTVEDKFLGSFLFDTGASGIILDGQFARNNQIPTISSERLFGEKKYTYGSGEGRMETEFVRELSVDLHTISLEEENVRVLELNHLLGESLGHKIDGIVGYDVFKDYLIDIRFDLGYMRFVKSKSDVSLEHYARLAYDNNYQKPIVPLVLNLNNGHTFTANCIFDMGSADGLALNSRKIYDEALFSKTEVYNCADNRLGGIGGQSSSCYAKIQSIEIGEQLVFEGVEVEMSRDKRGALGWHDMYDGLLGMDIIRHYNVIIDQKNKLLYLGIPKSP